MWTGIQAANAPNQDCVLHWEGTKSSMVAQGVCKVQIQLGHVQRVLYFSQYSVIISEDVHMTHANSIIGLSSFHTCQ